MNEQTQMDAMLSAGKSVPTQDPQLQAMLDAGLKPNESAAVLGHSNGLLGNIIGGIQSAAHGVAKQGTSDILGLGEAGAKLGSMIPGKTGEMFGQGAQALETARQSPALQGENKVEQAAQLGTQVGEFFIPGGAEKGIATKGAEYINKLPDVLGMTGKAAEFIKGALNTALKSVIGAGSMGGITAAQTGGDVGQIKTGAELGAGGGALSALKYAKGLMPDVLSFTSGVPKGAVAKAMQNPDTLKIGMDMPIQEIRTKAETALSAIDKDMKSTFAQGLSDLQKKNPVRGGAFNNAKGYFATALQDAKAGVPSIFRDYGVSVQENGRTLDFEKLNSPIVKGAEQNNLQSALDTINRQTDFSPRGVQRTAARLEALTKYGENNESSAIITRVKNAYSSAIEKAYPELGALRTQYGETASKISDIKSIIGKASDSPKSIQTAVNRLSQIYSDDKETYLNTVKMLGQMTGVDFEGLIASDKFKQVMPSYIRGLGGGGAVSLGSAAVAHFLNPFYLLALPLFSPKAVGMGIRAGESLPAIGSAATRATTGGIQAMNESTQPVSSQ